MRRAKGWLAAAACCALLALAGCGWAEAAYSLEGQGVRLYAPEDWEVITAQNVQTHAQTLAEWGTSPEVVLADLAASGAAALLYAPDMEVRLTLGPPTGAQSVWQADAAQREALLAQALTAYPGLSGEWLSGDYIRLAGREEAGGLTVYRRVLATCQYGQLYAFEAARYGQDFTRAQEEQLARLGEGLLILGAKAQTAPAPAAVPPVELPQNSGEAAIRVQRDDTPITLAGAPAKVVSGSFTLSGVTAPQTDMRYYVNQVGIERFTSDSDGNFTVEIKKLSAGKNTVMIQAMSEAGYGTVSFTCQYQSAQTPVNLAEVPQTVPGSAYTFTGKTLPGAAVTLLWRNTKTQAQVAADGSFTVEARLPKAQAYQFTLRAEHPDYKRRDIKLTLQRGMTPQERAASQLKKARQVDYAQLLEAPEKFEGRLTAPKGRLTALSHTAQEGPAALFADEAGNRYALSCENLLGLAEGPGQALLSLMGALNGEGLPQAGLIAFYPQEAEN